MSIPSASAAQPLSRVVRHAARNRAQTLVKLIGADSGSYPTQHEIDKCVNSWAANVNPDLEMTPPVTVISNLELPTESSDPVTVNTTSVLDNIRSPSEESALGQIMGIICDGGFPLDEEPIQAPVRATVVRRGAERDAERNAVLAGDPKGLVYYVMID